MDKHFLARGLGALLLAGLGTAVSAQEDDEGERRVRIEITKNENGKTSHITREFDLNNDAELHDALRELGVIDELSTIGDGENLVLDLRRMNEGGLLNDMSLALTMPEDAPDPMDAEETEPKPYLGVNYADWSSCNDKRKKDLPPVKVGAYISGVIDGSSAEAAGLAEGDVVVVFEDRKITSGQDLVDAIEDQEPGKPVKITYYRGKQKRTAKAVLGWREETRNVSRWNWSGNDSGPDWEAYFGDAAIPEEQGFFGVIGGSSDDDKPGARIGEVVKGSSAETMGVREGDLIRRINGKTLNDFNDLAETVTGMEPGEDMDVELLRGSKELTLHGTLGQRTVNAWNWNGTVPPMPPMPPTPPPPAAPLPPSFDDARRRAMADEARARANEMRAQMDELRSEMDRLRQELRGNITREMRVNINTIELSPEETAVLKGKGVANLDVQLQLNDLRCFPNPSEGSFHLIFTVPERGDLSVDVHDATGERVYHEVISGFKGNYDRTLDLSDRATGTYYVVIAQNGRTQSRKLVKK